MDASIRHIVVEGLPAVGKSEVLALLARFYPGSVRVLPELVKSVVEAERIDLFRERNRLTQALADALPRRRAEIETAVTEGYLCLEESHLGAHYAYSAALGDAGFLAAYPELESKAPRPDLYLRLDIPVEESIERQAARGTPQYAIGAPLLESFVASLNRWHTERRTSLLVLDADRSAGATAADLERALGLSYVSRGATSTAAFDVLLLLGRPASGKSEFIEFMNHLRGRERVGRYHIGTLSVADDFPILWRLFQDDDTWESLHRPRRVSRRADGNYAVVDDGVWAFLIGRLLSDVTSRPHTKGATTLVEFSRGGSAGYRDALRLFPPELLARTAIVYLSVSFEESWRRNLARYDENRRGGIRTHSGPREEMERTYGTDDWADLTGNRPSGRLSVEGVDVPYATLPNEPESVDPSVLGPRYQGALDSLFHLWRDPDYGRSSPKTRAKLA